MLMNKGLHRDERLLSERSVEMMTTNHLTPEQIVGGGVLLSGSGWGFGMAVTVAPDDMSPVPGRYGWSGGYGTTWFNDPHQQLLAIALTQTDGFLFNGGLLPGPVRALPPLSAPAVPGRAQLSADAVAYLPALWRPGAWRGVHDGILAVGPALAPGFYNLCRR
jgi:CubicO group peptidase (beta-lactamase class C family)